MKLETNWVVMKIIRRDSFYGNMMDEVTFANAHGEIAHTYLDPTNMNYARWRDIIDLYGRGCGVIVNGLRAKRNGKHKKTGEPLVNADSPVHIIHVDADMQVVLNDLVAVLTEDDPIDPKQQLFT